MLDLRLIWQSKKVVEQEMNNVNNEESRLSSPFRQVAFWYTLNVFMQWKGRRKCTIPIIESE